MKEIRLQARAILDNTTEPTFSDWGLAVNFLFENHFRLDTHIRKMIFNRCEWYRQHFNKPRFKTVWLARNSGEMQSLQVRIDAENIEKWDVFPNIYKLNIP